MLLRRKGFRVIPVNPVLKPDALIDVLGECTARGLTDNFGKGNGPASDRPK